MFDLLFPSVALPLVYLHGMLAFGLFFPWSLLPLCGTAGLVLGAAGAGAGYRRRMLVWLAVPVAASHLLVALSEYFRGAVATGDPLLQQIQFGFLAAQCLYAVILMARFWGRIVPAMGLSVFAVTYAMAAIFIASFSLAPGWD